MRKLRQEASALEETPRRKLLSSLHTRGVLPETLGLRLPGARPRTRIGGVVKAARGWRRREGSRQKEGGPEPSRPLEPSGSLGGRPGRANELGGPRCGPHPTPPHPGPGGKRRGRGGEGAARALMTVDSALRSGRAHHGQLLGRFPPTVQARAPRRAVRGGAVRGRAARARVPRACWSGSSRAGSSPRGQAGNESNHGNPPEEVDSAGDVNPLSPELGQPDFPFSHSN